MPKGVYWKELLPDGSKLECSVANLKLGADCIIFNPGGAAMDCMGEKLGMCRVCNECYAKDRERQYKAVLRYRRRQQKFFDTHTDHEIAQAFCAMLARGKRLEKITRARIGESGEIRNQADLDKINSAMRLVKRFCEANGSRLDCGAYSVRSDLDFTNIDAINYMGSGHDACHGQVIVINDRSELPEGFRLCPEDCRKCRMCLRRGAKVALLLHRPGNNKAQAKARAARKARMERAA